MGWLRIDDQAAFAPKVVKAGNAAFGLWARLAAYSNAHLTDGFVPDSIVRMLCTRRELRHLYDADLAAADLDRGGIQLRGLFGDDYCEHQFSREESTDRRQSLSKSRAEAGRLGGLKKAANRRNDSIPASKFASSLPASNVAPTPPLPTPPGDQDNVDLSHSTGVCQDDAAGDGVRMRVDRSALKTLWFEKTRLRGEFVAGLELAADRIEEYALVTKGDAMQIAERALDAFVRYCETRSAGYQPSRTGYKFVEHWDKIEPVLAGWGDIAPSPRKASDGPALVSGLSFARKDRP